MIDTYEKIVDKVVEISKLTSKENSILYEFSLNDKMIDMNISLINHSGEKKLLDSDSVNVENKFNTFITPLIKEFCDKNKIVLNDFVDINEDNIVTYRLITDNNDQLSIDGLTFEDANYIRDVVDEINRDNPKVFVLSDDKGAANIWFVITIIILIGVVIGCFAYLI